MKQQQANFLEDHYKTPVMFQAQTGVAVTPSDSTELQSGVLYIGTGGNVSVKTRTGSDLVFKNINDGTWLPVVCTMVYATDTTASDINLVW